MDWNAQTIYLDDKLEIIDGFIETMQTLLDIMQQEPDQTTPDIARIARHKDILKAIKSDLIQYNSSQNEADEL